MITEIDQKSIDSNKVGLMAIRTPVTLLTPMKQKRIIILSCSDGRCVYNCINISAYLLELPTSIAIIIANIQRIIAASSSSTDDHIYINIYQKEIIQSISDQNKKVDLIVFQTILFKTLRRICRGREFVVFCSRSKKDIKNSNP
jgi:hypothetical protein